VIKWLGHATVRIDAQNLVIFFDPYDIKERVKADLVLISHDHFDHCSLDDLRKVSAKRTHLVGPPVQKVQSVLRRVTNHVHSINAGEEIEVLGVKIKAVPAYNIDKPFHPKSAGGIGYVIEVEGKKIYFAGDTDLIPEMKALKKLNIDVALLPVGGVYTMNVEEAARAFKMIGAKEGIPIHYGTIIGTGTDGEQFKRLIAT